MVTFHYPEKAVPLFTTNAMDNIAIPIYGDGLQMRDYQYVTDHCEGIDVVLHKGIAGEAYNVGTSVETRNIDMAHKILDILGKPYSLIEFVKDRAGHDRRYAIDATKINKELGWKPSVTFEQGLEKTIDWFLSNEEWLQNVTSGEYQNYYQKQYN
jgi:dTDP-glucose 4,6-dehydratase